MKTVKSNGRRIVNNEKVRFGNNKIAPVRPVHIIIQQRRDLGIELATSPSYTQNIPAIIILLRSFSAMHTYLYNIRTLYRTITVKTVIQSENPDKIVCSLIRTNIRRHAFLHTVRRGRVRNHYIIIYSLYKLGRYRTYDILSNEIFKFRLMYADVFVKIV